MNHSKMFYKIKEYYDNAHWTADMVYNAVKKGIITEDEYKEIVGENFK